MNDAKILLVDDEATILHMLKTVLHKEGFAQVDTATSGEAAISFCESKHYDLIVLDVMLPGQSGIEICPFLRKTTDAPILFLTARTSDFDILTGFAVGGDDYITKPFNPLEVVARIKSQLRRHLKQPAAAEPRPDTAFDFGRFQVDEKTGVLTVDGEESHCPALVFQLLLFLCRHPNRIFSKNELYERVWGDGSVNDDNTVMVHIHRIRERIEADPSKPEYLVNVRGLGYKLIRKGEAR
ncbi:response regulator transcription factor [Paenibacillus oenotherae]|uniref:Response regulator transcription factor n=1 Tax=Paenibacillus oenotherae TaxID=1435645 RepID=A0ABS7D454_9BACL|nr:response regulator transcription factor [Paenibacillus oenotherae]MBW7474704.1 response regulator transcription factor [Paenibacillus oenotherae]